MKPTRSNMNIKKTGSKVLGNREHAFIIEELDNNYKTFTMYNKNNEELLKFINCNIIDRDYSELINKLESNESFYGAEIMEKLENNYKYEITVTYVPLCDYDDTCLYFNWSDKLSASAHASPFKITKDDLFNLLNRKA